VNGVCQALIEHVVHALICSRENFSRSATVFGDAFVLIQLGAAMVFASLAAVSCPFCLQELKRDIAVVRIINNYQADSERLRKVRGSE